MIQKIIILIAIALYFTGCSAVEDHFTRVTEYECSRSTCEPVGPYKPILGRWSDGELTFDFSQGSYNIPFQALITDSEGGSCPMTAIIDPEIYTSDGTMLLDSGDEICATLFGGRYKFSHLDVMLILSGGNAGKTYKLQ